MFDSGPHTEQPPPSYAEIGQPQQNDNALYVRIGDRLIFDFEKWRQGGHETGLLPQEAKMQAPAELKDRVSDGKWREWMAELDAAHSKGRSISELALLYFFPGCGLQYICCCLCCPISMSHSCDFLPWCLGDWHGGLRQWAENVSEYLESFGMHAKLVTYQPYWDAPRSKMYDQRVYRKNHKYEMSFLVISLSHEESEKLRGEDWNHGVRCTCLLGCKGRAV